MAPEVQYSPRQSVPELLAAGHTAAQLRAVGVPVNAMQDAGVTVTTMLQAGYTVQELHEGGYGVQELLQEGAPPLDLKAAGFTAADMHGVLTPAELHGVYMAAELHGTYTAEELHGVYAAEELHGVYMAQELHVAYTAKELHGVYTPQEVYGVYTPAEIHGVYSAEEMLGSLVDETAQAVAQYDQEIAHALDTTGQFDAFATQFSDDVTQAEAAAAHQLAACEAQVGQLEATLPSACTPPTPLSMPSRGRPVRSWPESSTTWRRQSHTSRHCGRRRTTCVRPWTSKCTRCRPRWTGCYLRHMS
jgi:hypothetical protein